MGASFPSSVGRLESAEQRAQETLVSLECGYYDVEQVQLMSQMLLVTLGTACVEKTYGGLFNSPAKVVEDVKKEMVEILHRRSDAFAEGSGSFEDSASLPSPVIVVENILDDFVQAQTGLLSRFSKRIINTEKKEDRIEDFVQELDTAGAWMVGCREDLAKALFKCLDHSNLLICAMKFESNEDLVEHKSKCALRPVTCANEGCGEVFSAIHDKVHDSTCPSKLIACEQNCKALVKRSEMDKHCITDCPMKLVNCPFYHMGCAATLPQGVLEQHCTEFTGSHLLCLQHFLQKQEALVAGVTQRVLVLEKTLSIAQRSEAINVGTLSLTVQEQDAKIKALEKEVTRLQKDIKAVDVSEEVLLLHREVRNLQKQIGTLSLRSSSLTSL
eukprot:c20300_g1_i3 orf=685-1842(-)